MTLKARTITKNTCGSITIAAHKARLRKALGNPPIASQLLFKRVNKRNNEMGDFVDNKSRMVSEKYDIHCQEKYGGVVSSQMEIDVEEWCEASGGQSKRRRLFGLGICRPTTHKIGTSSSSPVDVNDDGVSILRENFRNACEKIDELTRDKGELLRQMEEKAQEEESKRKAFEENVLRMLNLLSSCKGITGDCFCT